MMYELIFMGLCLGSILYNNAQQSGTECLKANARSCGECIQAGPNCGWCKKVDFLQEGEPTSARCDDLAALRLKGCPEEDIQNPRASKEKLKDNPITYKTKGNSVNSSEITQIRPQQLKFKLRSGEPQTFNLTFRRAENYPIDLYYLMDLSYSMKNDLENVKNLGTVIMEKMKQITSDFKIGFGSFVEKTVMPYISTNPAKLINPCTTNQQCTSPFSFKHVLSLTNNGSLFNELVGKQEISGNLDSPEGGFDAIMQVAVCGGCGLLCEGAEQLQGSCHRITVCWSCRSDRSGDPWGDNRGLLVVCVTEQCDGVVVPPYGLTTAETETSICPDPDLIGWRNVTRLLVFSTDAGFHFAGDGKLGGIVLPNDGKCHMQDNMYTMSHYYFNCKS
ncbi:hypothetical protein AB205_0096720 [Aquarana catesbeiana]|uniref:Integrin beta n=1 Tax=Aquarana catesbeiana TaxID=8400 RepID=A0A2G9RSE4_AQUCT|nr:hypothetical protein AB205_0096720 [Aquarana catesbeiana]